MISTIRNDVLNFFHILCVITTIGLVAWCIHEYTLDHDYSETRFGNFHQTLDDIYPSLTICDEDPFLPAKHDVYLRNVPIIGKKFKQSENSFEEASGKWSSKILFSYNLFLNGRNGSLVAKSDWLRELNITYDQLLLVLQNIDYDQITAGLEDLLTELYIEFPINSEHHLLLSYHNQNGSFIAKEVNIQDIENSPNWDGKSIDEFRQVKSYISLREAFRKCVTIDVPFQENVNIRQIGMRFNTSNLVGKKISKDKFSFYLTYPRQVLRNLAGSRIKFPIDIPVTCYRFEILIGYIRVFKRRNKNRAPCNYEWKFHDDQQRRHVMKKIGCNPRHWKVPSYLPYCYNPHDYSEAKKELWKQNGFMQPCRSIETMMKATKGKTDWRILDIENLA